MLYLSKAKSLVLSVLWLLLLLGQLLIVYEPSLDVSSYARVWLSSIGLDDVCERSLRDSEDPFYMRQYFWQWWLGGLNRPAVYDFCHGRGRTLLESLSTYPVETLKTVGRNTVLGATTVYKVCLLWTPLMAFVVPTMGDPLQTYVRIAYVVLLTVLGFTLFLFVRTVFEPFMNEWSTGLRVWVTIPYLLVRLFAELGLAPHRLIDCAKFTMPSIVYWLLALLCVSKFILNSFWPVSHFWDTDYLSHCLQQAWDYLEGRLDGTSTVSTELALPLMELLPDSAVVFNIDYTSLLKAVAHVLRVLWCWWDIQEYALLTFVLDRTWLKHHRIELQPTGAHMRFLLVFFAFVYIGWDPVFGLIEQAPDWILLVLHFEYSLRVRVPLLPRLLRFGIQCLIPILFLRNRKENGREQ